MQDIYIVGAGGMGREVEALISALNERRSAWRIVGFVDDAPTDRNARLVADLGHRIVGGVEDLIREGHGSYALAIGDSQIRASVADRLSASALEPATLIHPDATIGRLITCGEGSIICSGVRTSTNISFGRHSIIGAGVVVGHDTTVGDFCTLMAGCVIAGGVELGRGSMVGASATVLQYLDVGRQAKVGAGAVVVRAVPEGVTVKGVPAR